MESNALHHFALLSHYFLNVSRTWLFVLIQEVIFIANVKALSHKKNVINKPQVVGKVNSPLYCRTQKKKVQHSSALKKNEAQLLGYLK